MTERMRRTLWILTAALVVSALVGVKLGVDRHRLATAYQDATAALAQLEAERARLTEELQGAQGTISEQDGQLVRLHDELGRIQTQLASLQHDVTTLQARNSDLQTQLALTTQQKQELEAKFSSIKELKLAIRSVRQQIWRERWDSLLAGLSGLHWRRAAADQELAQGNHGFVVRNGVPTLGSVTKLQVRVLEPQPE